MITLKDIRDYQVNSLSKMVGEFDQYEDGHPYDEDGHCSNSGLSDILSFWKEFKTDKDFKYFVSGEWFSDDIDLGGGRSYLLHDDKLLDMTFDYMYNNLKWSKEDYQEVIFNSSELSEELEDRFDDPSVIRDIKIDSLISKESKDKEVKTNIWDVVFDKNIPTKEVEYDYIPHVVKYSKNMRSTLDKCLDLEYIGDSRVDSDFICYRIKKLGCRIPSGYEVIQQIDEILNENI